MYLEHWNFSKFPFANTNDESSFFLSSGAEEALAAVFYAASSVRPFALLTGASGVGKSMVLHIARLELPDHQCEVGLINVPTGDADEIYSQILGAFDVAPPRVGGVAAAADALSEFGKTVVARGTRLVLLIDDAEQLQSPAMLERLRLLANFQHNGSYLFTVILSGKPELLDAITAHKSLAGRVEVQARLNPFNEEETVAYIGARLTAAGGAEDIFPADVAAKVYEATSGVARNINLLCDKALTDAFMRSEKRVSAAAVQRGVDELRQGGLSI